MKRTYSSILFLNVSVGCSFGDPAAIVQPHLEDVRQRYVQCPIQCLHVGLSQEEKSASSHEESAWNRDLSGQSAVAGHGIGRAPAGYPLSSQETAPVAYATDLDLGIDIDYILDELNKEQVSIDAFQIEDLFPSDTVEEDPAFQLPPSSGYCPENTTLPHAPSQCLDTGSSMPKVAIFQQTGAQMLGKKDPPSDFSPILPNKLTNVLTGLMSQNGINQHQHVGIQIQLKMNNIIYQAVTIPPIESTNALMSQQGIHWHQPVEKRLKKEEIVRQAIAKMFEQGKKVTRIDLFQQINTELKKQEIPPIKSPNALSWFMSRYGIHWHQPLGVEIRQKKKKIIRQTIAKLDQDKKITYRDLLRMVNPVLEEQGIPPFQSISALSWFMSRYGIRLHQTLSVEEQLTKKEIVCQTIARLAQYQYRKVTYVDLLWTVNPILEEQGIPPIRSISALVWFMSQHGINSRFLSK